MLEVKLVGLPSPLAAGSSHQVLCQAAGGHPPPSLGWNLTSPEGLVTR